MLLRAAIDRILFNRLAGILVYLALPLTIPGAYAANINFSGYLKSYNVWQDSTKTPAFQSDAQLQSQNSIRLNLQGFGETGGVNSVWQVHYETSPIIASGESGIDPGTLSSSEGRWRLTDIRASLGEETPKHRILQNLDRFNLQLNFGSGDLTIGRQAISFGAARFINPTDVFLPFDVRTFNTEYRTGIDAIRFQRPFGQLGELDFGLILGPDGKAENSAAFAQIKTNLGGSDFHATAIRFAEQNLLGIGVQSSLADFGTWFEAARVNGQQDYWRASMGLDYSFSESTLASVEYHFNGAGSDNPSNYFNLLSQTPFTLGGVFLLGKNYLIPAVSIQLSALISAGIQGVLNLDDHSTYTSVTLSYNVKEDLYLGAGYYHFSGSKLTLSPLGNPVLNSEYGSNPDNLFVSINYYF